MQLTGFHHLTAVTAAAARNRAFYTDTLGMRLVKKTVNQDDTSAYHLFYADGKGSPGTDITFFDWPTPRERRGTHSIARTGLRVAGTESLKYWADRLTSLGVTHTGTVETNGRPTLEFEDFEGQRLSLVADEGDWTPNPWARSPVPAEHQVRGLGPITLSVPDVRPTETMLTKVMNMRKTGQFTAKPTDGSEGESTVHVYQSGLAGPAGELHVAEEPKLPMARAGAGGVHHVAFRVPTFADYDAWQARLGQLGVPNSGAVDRFYFRSLYFREPNGILFELATDEPGFHADEPMETLGERLSLPPFLEDRRAQIEAHLKPL
jgi:glyoxalase family protein